MNTLKNALILAIDDDANVLALLNKLLAKQCKQFIFQTDAQAGLNLACTEQPDLILLDLNLPGADVDAPGVAQMLLGFLVTGGIGPFEAHQSGQGGSGAALQAQCRIGRVMALLFAGMVVVIALQFEGAKEAIDREGSAPFVVVAGGRLIVGIDAVGRPLQEITHHLIGRLEHGGAQEHFQFLDGDPGGRVGLKTGHQLPDFLVFGQEELWRGVFFFAPAARSARVRSTRSWAY